jgi:hypothetical protein
MALVALRALALTPLSVQHAAAAPIATQTPISHLVVI